MAESTEDHCRRRSCLPSVPDSAEAVQLDRVGETAQASTLARGRRRKLIESASFCVPSKTEKRCFASSRLVGFLAEVAESQWPGS
jgi:hypothetical protein